MKIFSTIYFIFYEYIRELVIEANFKKDHLKTYK